MLFGFSCINSRNLLALNCCYWQWHSCSYLWTCLLCCLWDIQLCLWTTI